MGDPYGFIVDLCKYSSSQEDRLTHSLFAREDELSTSSQPYSEGPEPYDPLVALNDGGIMILSPPETPTSEAETIFQAEEFRTPPEECRRSSSEEPSRPPLEISTVNNPKDRNAGCQKTAGTDIYSGDSDGESSECLMAAGKKSGLGVLEQKRRSTVVELVSGGKVLVADVSRVESRSFINRDALLKEGSASPPSKRLRVSGSRTPNAASEVRDRILSNSVFVGNENRAGGEGKARAVVSIRREEEKEEGGYPSKMILNFTVETHEHDINDVDVGFGVIDGKSPTVDTKEVIIDDKAEEESCKGHVKADHETRKLPLSLFQTAQEFECGYEYVDNRRRALSGGEKGDSAGKLMERTEASNKTEQVKSLWEVLAMLSRDVRREKFFDILETAKSRGIKFHRPRWWGDVGDDDWLED